VTATRKLVVIAVTLVAFVIGVILAPLFWIAGDTLFPSLVSWDSKSAYVKCDGAIARAAEWPKERATACAAMSLCANEAVLSPPQTAMLTAAARRIGCPEF